MRILKFIKITSKQQIISFFIYCLCCSILNVSAQEDNSSVSYAVQMAESEMSRNPQAGTTPMV